MAENARMVILNDQLNVSSGAEALDIGKVYRVGNDHDGIHDPPRRLAGPCYEIMANRIQYVYTHEAYRR